MDRTLELAGMVAEVFTWVGLAIAVVCFIALGLLRAFEGRWVETDAVVVEDAQDVRLRWMSTSGLHERLVAPEERYRVTQPDGLRLYYRARTPSRSRFEPAGDGEKTLRLLGLLFLGVGGLALVVSVILVFLPE